MKNNRAARAECILAHILFDIIENEERSRTGTQKIQNEVPSVEKKAPNLISIGLRSLWPSGAIQSFGFHN